MERISFPVTASKHPYQCLLHYTNSILFLGQNSKVIIMESDHQFYRDILSMSCQIYAKIFQLVLLSYLLACVSRSA